MGIGAGAGIEAQRAEAAQRAEKPQRAQAAQRAVTEHILALADRAGNGAALIDAAASGPWPGQACVITWPQFACMVRAAARGLSRRGLREGDTAGIFVADAVSHAVAVHAVRAAGAIAVPVRPEQTAADIAAQLKPCRARVLITSAALAGLAVQAAERCWVRQVFAFGEAEETTPFSSLLHTGLPGGAQDYARRAGTQAALDPAGLGEPEPPGCGRGGPALRRCRYLYLAARRGPRGWRHHRGGPAGAGPGRGARLPGDGRDHPRGTHVPGLPAGRVFTLGERAAPPLIRRSQRSPAHRARLQMTARQPPRYAWAVLREWGCR